MKKTILFLITITVILVPTSYSRANDASAKQVQVGVNDVMLPTRFDRNANAYGIVSGYFPNGCYSWNHSEIIHQGEFVHEVRSIADVKEGPCISVFVPFSNEIELGHFSRGQHTLKFLDDHGNYLEKSLNIEE